MGIGQELLEGSPLWSSGEERGYSLDKEQTSKDPTSLGRRGIGPRGKSHGVSVLLG